MGMDPPPLGRLEQLGSQAGSVLAALHQEQ
jgi:hypothetical protein